MAVNWEDLLKMKLILQHLTIKKVESMIADAKHVGEVFSKHPDEYDAPEAVRLARNIASTLDILTVNIETLHEIIDGLEVE